MRATARGRWRLAPLGALLLIAAWGAPTAHGAEARLRIVATLPDLFVLTRAVAGEGATVDLIARFGGPTFWSAMGSRRTRGST